MISLVGCGSSESAGEETASQPQTTQEQETGKDGEQTARSTLVRRCGGETGRFLDGLAIRGNDCQNKQDSVQSEVSDWLKGPGYYIDHRKL